MTVTADKSCQVCIAYVVPYTRSIRESVPWAPVKRVDEHVSVKFYTFETKYKQQGQNFSRFQPLLEIVKILFRMRLVVTGVCISILIY